MFYFYNLTRGRLRVYTSSDAVIAKYTVSPTEADHKLSMEGNRITIAAESPGNEFKTDVHRGRTMDGQNLVVYEGRAHYECNWFKDEDIDRELDSILRRVVYADREDWSKDEYENRGDGFKVDGKLDILPRDESKRERFAKLIMRRAGRPAMLDLIKSSTLIQWSSYLRLSDDSPTIRGKIVAAIGINDQTLKDYSGEIYLENLGDIDLTCKELPTCIKRIQKATLVLGDTLHINSHVVFDDVRVKYKFSDKSVIVVKGGAGTEDTPVTMKNVRFRFDKESSSVSTSPSESFLLDVESHVTLDTCKLSRSTGGGARVHDGGHLRATGTTFSGNKSTGVTVRGAGSTAVLEEGCTLSDNVSGAVVESGGHLEATGTTFIGNKEDGAIVQDGGHLEATATTFIGNKGDGVIVSGAGSTAVLEEGCTFSDNRIGVFVVKAGSKAVLKERCTLSDNVEACAYVQDGGHLEATGTTFSGNWSYGLRILADSTAVLKEGCTLWKNKVHGAFVFFGGNLEATGTTFSGNVSYGVEVEGYGSKAVLKEGCMLLDNESGAHVQDGGGLEATGTTFSGNKEVGVKVSGNTADLYEDKEDGVKVIGTPSKAVLKGCTLSKKKVGGAFVSKGGSLEATCTTFSGNDEGGVNFNVTDNSTGLSVTGPRSTAVLKEDCKLLDNEDTGAFVELGGSLEATGTTFSGNTLTGVYVTGTGSTAVLKEGCMVSESHSGGAIVSGGGLLKATRTTFSGNFNHGIFSIVKRRWYSGSTIEEAFAAVTPAHNAAFFRNSMAHKGFEP
ncbi:hypothetical protein TSOC_005115 [Tetrabaena socialis]|uniref:Right handed beta helix domain-containing protein n=1 Tax=Tetrabaena socialis TaxID=47790 RepID=A0A2J8A7B6_9CHLO|nr:hypothetical protein TSOC_005115 [Tetrabaena socialis]|eukprot:PNH08380.1 hypothetical protein TSOC_005115 [Tetrabaena socialis]